MKNIYFIILNYNTAKETINCIESIRKLDGLEFKKNIIVIDNCSPDESFTNLNDYYNSDPNISIYQMTNNLGFSKANNYGYNIVQEYCDANFCIVCNSDIIFVQRDFLVRMEREYNDSHFFICGPNVYCPAKKNTYLKGRQSPMYPFEWHRNYVMSYFLYNKIQYERLQGKKSHSLKM